jgi:hypothetical protein
MSANAYINHLQTLQALLSAFSLAKEETADIKIKDCMQTE